jgi:hypothetical protein
MHAEVSTDEGSGFGVQDFASESIDTLTTQSPPRLNPEP